VLPERPGSRAWGRSPKQGPVIDRAPVGPDGTKIASSAHRWLNRQGNLVLNPAEFRQDRGAKDGMEGARAGLEPGLLPLRSGPGRW